MDLGARFAQFVPAPACAQVEARAQVEATVELSRQPDTFSSAAVAKSAAQQLQEHKQHNCYEQHSGAVSADEMRRQRLARFDQPTKSEKPSSPNRFRGQLPQPQPQPKLRSQQSEDPEAASHTVDVRLAGLSIGNTDRDRNRDSTLRTGSGFRLHR